jgi:hypothetical protein
MLYALSMCFNLPEARNSYFLAYIDELLISILTFNSHSLIQAAVLQVLAKYLPRTNRNRIRIETTYRKAVKNLMNLHENEESPKPAVAYLITSLHFFVSVWSPLPTDHSILFSEGRRN